MSVLGENISIAAASLWTSVFRCAMSLIIISNGVSKRILWYLGLSQSFEKTNVYIIVHAQVLRMVRLNGMFC